MRPIATKLHLFAVGLTVGLTSGARGDDLPAPIVLKGHAGRIRAVAFSPDGAILASASWDDTVRLWNVADGKEIRVLRDQGPVRSVAFSVDGKKLAVAGGEFVLWDVESGKKLRTLFGHVAAVNQVVFTSDGKTLASASGDKTVRFWDLGKAAPSRNLYYPHEVNSLAVTSDEKMVVSAGDDGAIPLSSRDTSKIIRNFAGHEGAVASVAFSPECRRLASGGADGMVRLWDVATGKQLLACVGHKNRVLAVAFAPDGKAAASAGADGTVRLWDVAGGKEIAVFDGARGAEAAFAFAPDGKTLATSGPDNTLLIQEWRPEPRSSAAPKPRDLRALWDQLIDDDAVRAWRAVGALARSPEQSIPFLKDRVRPEAAPTPERLNALLADLENPEFAVREQAAATLTQLGELAEPTLRRALKDGKPSLELRRRVEAVLDEPPTWSGEPLRLWRAIQVLETIGTPEARVVLKTLSEGVAASRVTQEAQAALRRLEPRPPTD